MGNRTSLFATKIRDALKLPSGVVPVLPVPRSPYPRTTSRMVQTSGKDGANATVKSSGDEGTPAEEVNGVDKADVPEGVRRQVKSYFE